MGRGKGAGKNCNTLALCKAIFHYRRTEQKLKRQAGCPTTRLGGSAGCSLPDCCWKPACLPAFASEGEPGESHVAMKLPADTFVMSAASGDCQGEGGRVLTLLGCVGVFCVTWEAGCPWGSRCLKHGRRGGELRISSPRRCSGLDWIGPPNPQAIAGSQKSPMQLPFLLL